MITAASRPGTPDGIEPVNKYVAWGAGVRATQYLALGAKATAALVGRAAATADDVKTVALPVMRHRIVCSFAAQANGLNSDMIIDRHADEDNAVLEHAREDIVRTLTTIRGFDDHRHEAHRQFSSSFC